MRNHTGGIIAAACAVVAFGAVAAWELGTTVASARPATFQSRRLSAGVDSEPPRTSTPDTPGIVIASSNRFDMPDPFVLTANGEYYMYLSTAFDDPSGSNVPVMVGAPGNWSPISDAMPQAPAWSVPASQGGRTWDPYVAYLDGRYIMYSAPQLRDAPSTSHCLGVSVSSSPGGPFVPLSGPPLVCQINLGGDIDSQIFYDPNGPDGSAHPNYLIWKSDNNNLAGSGTTTIWAAPLANDGLHISGPFTAIFTADEPWEEPVLEAPQMVVAPNGTDWLFFSAGTGFYDSRYAMGVAECSGPLGGCHDVSNRPIIASNAQGPGPGEETVFTAPDSSTWVLYSPWHTMDPVAPLRPVEAARIGWGPDGPYVAEAGTFPPPPLSEIGLHLFSADSPALVAPGTATSPVEVTGVRKPQA